MTSKPVIRESEFVGHYPILKLLGLIPPSTYATNCLNISATVVAYNENHLVNHLVAKCSLMETRRNNSLNAFGQHIWPINIYSSSCYGK